MIISVTRRSPEPDGVPEVLDDVEVDGLNASSVRPVNEKVAMPLLLEDLSALCQQAQPAYPPEEAGSYYFQNAPTYADGVLKEDGMDIPSHIAFRAIAQSVLQKYGKKPEVTIELG
jgi:hypothetical protein